MIPKPFSLDVVLKIRKRKEDLAQQKLMKAISEQKAIENKIKIAALKQHKIIQLLQVKQEEGMLAIELGLFEERIDFVNSEIKSFHKLLKEKKQIVKNKRKHLLVKSKDHKVLKTLKYNQNLTWKQYLDKKEANMLDEIAILHHNKSPV